LEYVCRCRDQPPAVRTERHARGGAVAGGRFAAGARVPQLHGVVDDRPDKSRAVGAPGDLADHADHQPDGPDALAGWHVPDLPGLQAAASDLLAVGTEGHARSIAGALAARVLDEMMELLPRPGVPQHDGLVP